MVNRSRTPDPEAAEQWQVRGGGCRYRKRRRKFRQGWPEAGGAVRSISRHTVSMSALTCAMEARPDSQVISVECQV